MPPSHPTTQSSPDCRVSHEYKKVTRIRILRHNALGQFRQAIKLLAHVRHASGKPYLRLCRKRDQTINPSTKAKTAGNAVAPSTNMRRPSDSVMSTRCTDRKASSAGGGTDVRDESTPSISTGRKADTSSISRTSSETSAANRGSRSHLWIKLAFIEYRRATCATETLATRACAQIVCFSFVGELISQINS